MEKKVLMKQYAILGQSVWESIRTEMTWKEAVREVEEYADEPVEGKPNTYIAGSWLLEDAYGFLCGKPVESMHYVSGLKLGNYYTLERITEFDLSAQSSCSVKGDLPSSFKSLMDIEGHGYCLTAWFHSHPGTGKDSVFVSGTDIATQRRLESGKYPVIGAIFSQDGFIRFFSDSLDYDLRVLGKGVKKIDENVYKVSKA